MMAHPELLEQAATLTSLLPRVMRGIFARAGEDPTIELPVAQLRVCSVLYEGPRPMSAVGRELGLSLSSITQIADRLERSGLVERVADSEDRRVKSLTLTPRGVEMMSRRHAIRLQAAQAVLVRLTPAERGEALEALEALLHAAGGPAEEPAVAEADEVRSSL